MKILTPIATAAAAAALLTAAGTIHASDFHAAEYHEEGCTRCHDSSVYTREDRRIQSYPKLAAQVARCDANLGTALFPDDLQKLTDYLNDSYYQFDK